MNGSLSPLLLSPEPILGINLILLRANEILQRLPGIRLLGGLRLDRRAQQKRKDQLRAHHPRCDDGALHGSRSALLRQTGADGSRFVMFHRVEIVVVARLFGDDKSHED